MLNIKRRELTVPPPQPLHSTGWHVDWITVVGQSKACPNVREAGGRRWWKKDGYCPSNPELVSPPAATQESEVVACDLTDGKPLYWCRRGGKNSTDAYLVPGTAQECTACGCPPSRQQSLLRSYESSLSLEGLQSSGGGIDDKNKDSLVITKERMHSYQITKYRKFIKLLPKQKHTIRYIHKHHSKTRPQNYGLSIVIMLQVFGNMRRPTQKCETSVES